MTGSLFVISTPIGNPEDITLRALRILKQVSVVAAEDPKPTRALLDHYGIDARVTSYHNLNKEEKTPVLVKLLEDGQNIALVCDAGTPTVSDPGQYLVSRALASGLRVVPIPGASAILSAVAASGLPADAFTFYGDFPQRPGPRRRLLAALQSESNPGVLFVRSHRVKETLAMMRTVLGNRRLALATDMTKPRESFLYGTVEEILDALPSRPAQGEMTLVVEGNKRRSGSTRRRNVTRRSAS